MNSLLAMTNALANAKRLQILQWLKHPGRHFAPGQFDSAEGVCGLYIAQKLGISPPTACAHLKLLTQAGLLTSQRIGKYTYFRRNPAALRALTEHVGAL